MDVWAIGIMAFVMLFNRLPFNGPNRDVVKTQITTSEYQIPKTKIVTPEVQ